MPTSPDNPFLRPPQSFDPERYYGSQKWVVDAPQHISGTPALSMELIGLPGMGKSFLLRHLADPALFAEYIVGRTSGAASLQKETGASGIEARLFNYLEQHMHRPS